VIDWVFSLVPIAFIWGAAVVDIVTQPRMRRGVKVAWVVTCSLVWPVILGYWLVRPIRGRVERAPGQLDARDVLVSVVLDSEAGRLGAAEAGPRLAQLRPQIE